MKQMSDEQLISMTETFKNRLQSGENIEAIIPDAFAVVREASKRVLEYAPFRCAAYRWHRFNRRQYCRNAYR